MLYSREFLARGARSARRRGGVYCQWFHLLRDQRRGARARARRPTPSVFDHVAVWSTNRADLLLLGLPRRRSALDLAGSSAACSSRTSAPASSGSTIADLPDAARARDDSARRAARRRAARVRSTRSTTRASASKPGGLLRRAHGLAAVHGLRRRRRDRRRELAAAALSRAASTVDRPGVDPRRDRPSTPATRSLPGCGALAAAWAAANPNSDGFRMFAAKMQSGAARVRPPDARAARRSRRSPEAASGPAPQSSDATVHRGVRARRTARPRRAARRLGSAASSRTGVELCRPGLHAARRLTDGDAPPDPDDWLNPMPTRWRPRMRRPRRGPRNAARRPRC